MRTGGGYVFPSSPEMFEFMFQVVDVLKANGKNAAVLFLSYGTSLHPHLSKQTNKTRSRTRRSLPPTTPTSLRTPQPRPNQTRNPTKEHNTHRRLRRCKPSPISPFAHLPPTPLNNRPNPTNLPLRASPCRRSNLALDRFLDKRSVL